MRSKVKDRSGSQKKTKNKNKKTTTLTSCPKLTNLGNKGRCTKPHESSHLCEAQPLTIACLTTLDHWGCIVGNEGIIDWTPGTVLTESNLLVGHLTV